MHYTNRKIEIVPSILSADFSRLGEQVRDAVQAGAGRIQVDVMDGHFVPNITVGPLIVEAIRPHCTVPIEAHLMIEQPELYIPQFAKAGADYIIVHVEACVHLHRVVQQIHGEGKLAGVAINPATPLVALEEILPYADMILVMTVNPGFGGQEFIPTMLAKIRRLKAMMEEHHVDLDIEVDGGIHEATIADAVAAGANLLVAGSAVYGAPDGVSAAISRLRAAIGQQS
ncbi:MAG TPA: ribulose-phosphate 3-epimerase [Chloroflexia bacterium]|nr:ribulose-phosphate 3-epimerase [Chloroflexia bacterium]